MSTLGTVFDIKEFAIFDGPGIRTTVFMKGCPMRCQWCHNPEGLSFEPQLLISHDSCTHCGNCQKVCKHQDGCITCGKCIGDCPLRLRKICGVKYTAKDLAALLLKDKDFLYKNHGGITFSGGEPLAQHEFLLEVLRELNNVHKAVETSGYCKEEVFRQVISQLDLIIMDIKLVNPQLHKQYTGVDNTVILKNLEHLKQSGKPFIIRIPLIPGVNDTDENLSQTADLLIGAKSIQKVELLPYHKTAGAKYSMVGKKYTPKFDTEQPPNCNTEIFTRNNILCTVM